MSELPKIVRQRLAAGQRPGNEHPDADLLAALAEQRLSGTERERLLGHLAQCAECREIAAVAAPREEPTQTVVRPVRRGWWFFQPKVVRWGSAAAVVALLAVGVSLYRSKGRPGEPKMATYTELSQAARVPAAPAAGEAAKVKAAPPAEAMARRAAQPREKLERPERQELAANQLKKDVAEPKEAAGSASVIGGLASAGRAQVNSRDATSAGAAAEAETVNSAPAAAPVAKSEVAQNVPAPAAEDKVAAAPSKSKQAGATNETVAVESQAASTSAELAQPSVSRRYADKAAAVAPSRWSVSSDGRVEISRDGGRSWTKLAVARDVRFLAVSATGGDVWAGGSGGALFHSADFGRTWTRVPVGTDEDIARVDFRDAQHGTVTSAAGAEWTTADGGKTWSAGKK